MQAVRVGWWDVYECLRCDAPTAMEFLAAVAYSCTSSLISSFVSACGKLKSFGPSYVKDFPFSMRIADGATGGLPSSW